MKARIYTQFTNLANLLQHPLLLAIRLYWGVLLIGTGYAKLMNLPGIISFFDDLHIPFPKIVATLVGIIELSGGIALVLGFLSRIFSLLLICVFIGAYSTAHLESVKQLLNHPSLFIKEEPFLYLYAALIVLCFGAGSFSLDYFFVEKKIKS